MKNFTLLLGASLRFRAEGEVTEDPSSNKDQAGEQEVTKITNTKA